VPDADLGLAEFFLAQSGKAVALCEDLAEWEETALIQPLSTVLNAVDRLGDVRGCSAAAIGLGSLGLLFCWLLRRRGADRILGIDPLPHRCQMAASFGASDMLPLPACEAVRSLRAAPARHAPDICVEAVGHQGQTLNDCIHLVADGGLVLAFGVPDEPIYAVEFETFFRKNARLIAVVTPDWHSYLRAARDLLVSSRDELARLTTHRFPILEAARAFDLYADHADGILKAVLDATSWQSSRA
jgi:threonine dehydrogenase-like Zn-dependent dehydrogenase